MGIKGFGSGLSEEGKKALKSETWQKARSHLKEKREVVHFTAERTVDYAYGAVWNQVVNEYLKTGYKEEGSNPDVVVMGVTYKTLKRPEVTVFYDAAGDTLFDVTNERLEKEYERMMNGGAGGATEEIAAAKEENAKPAKQRAKEKLENEQKSAKDSTFADPIIEYLLKRCDEDEGMAEDVVQEHKTWQKCFDYIYRQARQQAQGNCAYIRDEVVYEWAEDYYHKDDRAEEEKKAKEAAGARAKRENSAAEKKTAKAKRNTDKAEKVSAPPKPEAPKAPPKPKKNGKEMDGQLDLFAMMGM